MNKKIIIGLVIIVLIIGGVFIFSGGDKVVQENVREETFDKVIPFTLKDWNGNEVSISDFEGTPLILNSWAVWCPFCVDEMPDFVTLQEELGNRVVIIVINRAESTELQKEFADKVGITDKLVFLNDPRDSFYRSIGGFGMPETLFIDKDGNIRLHRRGSMSLEEMRKQVQLILE